MAKSVRGKSTESKSPKIVAPTNIFVGIDASLDHGAMVCLDSRGNIATPVWYYTTEAKFKKELKKFK